MFSNSKISSNLLCLVFFSMFVVGPLISMNQNVIAPESLRKRKHCKSAIYNMIINGLNSVPSEISGLKWIEKDKLFWINPVAFTQYYHALGNSSAKWNSIKNRLTKSKSGFICSTLHWKDVPTDFLVYTHTDWQLNYQQSPSLATSTNVEPSPIPVLQAPLPATLNSDFYANQSGNSEAAACAQTDYGSASAQLQAFPLSVDKNPEQTLRYSILYGQTSESVAAQPYQISSPYPLVEATGPTTTMISPRVQYSQTAIFPSVPSVPLILDPSPASSLVIPQALDQRKEGTKSDCCELTKQEIERLEFLGNPELLASQLLRFQTEKTKNDPYQTAQFDAKLFLSHFFSQDNLKTLRDADKKNMRVLFLSEGMSFSALSSTKLLSDFGKRFGPWNNICAHIDNFVRCGAKNWYVGKCDDQTAIKFLTGQYDKDPRDYHLIRAVDVNESEPKLRLLFVISYIVDGIIYNTDIWKDSEDRLCLVSTDGSIDIFRGFLEIIEAVVSKESVALGGSLLQELVLDNSIYRLPATIGNARPYKKR